jgi:hypothetical protein
MKRVAQEDNPYNFTELREFIHGQRFALQDSLITVGQLSSQLWRSKLNFLNIPFFDGLKNQETYVAQWHLAYIAKELIVTANDYQRNGLILKQVVLFANWYTNIPSTKRHAKQEHLSSDDKRFAWIELMMPLMSEQLAWQRHVAVMDIGRTLVMYLELAKRLEHRHKIEISAEFSHITGLTIEEFIGMGFAAFTQALTRSPAFVPSHLIPQNSRKEFFDPIKIGKFLNIVSRDYVTFRDEVRLEENKFPGAEKFALNPLIKWPIIKTRKRLFGPQEETYIVPVAPLLIDKITHGIYWTIVEAGGERSSSRPFQSLYGDLFEAYVGKVLGDFYDAEHLFPEQTYHVSRNLQKASCDWIVVEKETVILIECKTRRLSLRTKVLAERQEILEDLRKGVAKGLAQVIGTMRAVEAQLINIPKGQTYRGLIVVFDHIPPMFHLLDTEIIVLAKEVDPNITEVEIEKIDFRVLSVYDLEEFLHLIPTVGLIGAWSTENWNEARESKSQMIPPIVKQHLDKFFDSFMANVRIDNLED